MATPYSTIFNLFLFNIQDYLIDTMYSTSVADFENYAINFLLKAIPNFSFSCKQDLDDRDDTTKTFNITLTLEEQNILANLMTIEWLRKEINNILEMRNYLISGDFKAFSSANNLKEKREWYNVLSSEVKQMITSYGYFNTTWSNFLGI